jgi:hypothetical protein
MGNDKKWLEWLKVKPLEVEYLFSQADVLKPTKDGITGQFFGGVTSDMHAGVCYALSYEWVRQDVKPEKSLKPQKSLGFHGRAELAQGLGQKFQNTGEGDKPYGDTAEFCAAMGGSGSKLPQQILSMQRAMDAKREIKSDAPVTHFSGLSVICKSDGLTERSIALGPNLPTPYPMQGLLKWINQKKADLNKGYAVMGYRGDGKGHAVALQVAPNDVWRFFDPNLGVFRFQGYAKFLAWYRDIIEALYHDYSSGAWQISTFK